MLREAKQKHPAFLRGAPGRGVPNPAQSPSLRRRPVVLERRTGFAKALGFCGWALAGGTAFFAIWELGNFSVLIGSAPLLPTTVQEAAPPGAYRPAGGGNLETDGGCTQAPIDRTIGQTTPADCHTWARGRETITALLSGRASTP